MKFFTLLALVVGSSGILVARSVAAQSTTTSVSVPVPAGSLNIPASVVTVPASSISIPVIVTPTTVTVGSVVIPVPIPVVVPPPPPAAAWVYHGGKFLWGGDWSFSIHQPVNYSDVAGAPTAGPTDIQIINTGAWGGWQPFVNANCQSSITLCFITTPYKAIVFQAKATLANQTFQLNILSSGDTIDGVAVNTAGTGYCTAPTIGTWMQCTVPLAAFKLTDTTILKFSISDQTGQSNNTWYLQEVGFQ
jgi:hypothetical protein